MIQIAHLLDIVDCGATGCRATECLCTSHNILIVGNDKQSSVIYAYVWVVMLIPIRNCTHSADTNTMLYVCTHTGAPYKHQPTIWTVHIQQNTRIHSYKHKRAHTSHAHTLQSTRYVVQQNNCKTISVWKEQRHHPIITTRTEHTREAKKKTKIDSIYTLYKIDLARERASVNWKATTEHREAHSLIFIFNFNAVCGQFLPH